MKSIDQNNDNLEQFFKQHLDNHSPDLSPDFWADIEGFIPPKPPFWVLWAGSVKQFLLPTVLFSGLVLMSILYWDTIHEKENLSLLSADQQMKIAQIEAQNKTLKKQLKSTNVHQIETLYKLNSPSRTYQLTKIAQLIEEKKCSTPTNSEAALTTKGKSQALEKSSFFKNNNRGLNNRSKGSAIDTMNEIGASQIIAFPSQPLTPKGEMPPAVTIWNAAHEIETTEAASKKAILNLITASPKPINNTTITPFLITNNIPFITRVNPKNPLSQTAHIKGDILSKDRLSFEGGTLVFVQNLKTESDSINAKSTSYGASLLMNFELNHQWLLQSGFQIKSIHSPTNTRNYNSIPLNVKRKFTFDNGCVLEPRLGLAYNILVNAKTPETTARPEEIAASYMDITSSLAFAIPFNKNLHFIIEPNLGYSLTPIIDNEKAISYGIYLGIRYQN